MIPRLAISTAATPREPEGRRDRRPPDERPNFLRRERAALESFLPGLDERLASLPLEELERPGNPGIELYRAAGGAGLVVPGEMGGLGASATQATWIHRALGSRSPSLAVAMTMHNYTIATLTPFPVFARTGSLFAEMVRERKLIASGFAEGKPGQSIRKSSIRARTVPGGYELTGTKKPCSLSQSMDWLFASCTVFDEGGDASRLGVALVRGDDPRIVREPFWNTSVLTGAESETVVLDGIFVPEERFYVIQSDETGALDRAEIAGTVWFLLLATASYLGMASALVERVLLAGKGADVERARLAMEMENTACALDGAAGELETVGASRELLSRTLFVRFAAQEAIQRASGAAAEILGGMAFIGSNDVAYLLGASRALAFHPPSRTSIAQNLATHMAGASMQLV
jgi:alkylation response protein AidB-like acyl-CoA dehydrogenase